MLGTVAGDVCAVPVGKWAHLVGIIRGKTRPTLRYTNTSSSRIVQNPTMASTADTLAPPDSAVGAYLVPFPGLLVVVAY